MRLRRGAFPRCRDMGAGSRASSGPDMERAHARGAEDDRVRDDTCLRTAYLACVTVMALAYFWMLEVI